MYDQEEKRLIDLRKRLEKIDIPLHLADEAIVAGMEKAKSEKKIKRKKRKRLITTVALCAILLLTLITSIRISPAFANALSSIPGIEKIVQLLEYDKGLTSVLENEYYQKINKTQTINNVTLTIDGAILDESGINIFYTLTSSESLSGGTMKEINLNNKEELPEHTVSSAYSIEGDNEKEFHDMVTYQFTDSFTFKELQFEFGLVAKINNQEINFSIPFELSENMKKSIPYRLNKSVEIEGQHFRIKEITVYPLRIGVKVAFDPANTKKILGFEDLRLENEDGEVWSSIVTGTTTRHISENEKIYYLQSNYFDKPNQLYLHINQLMAIDKEEAEVIVDTEKNKLMTVPKDGKLKLGESSKSHLDFYMDEKWEDNYNIFVSAIDANGKELSIPSTEMHNEENKKAWLLQLEDTKYKNPLRLELTAYPNYIEGDIRLKLK